MANDAPTSADAADEAPRITSGGGADEAERALMRKRARELARRQSTIAVRPVADHVILRVGEQRYAVPAANVREALPLREITSLPTTPPTIRGIVLVRGRVVAVADLWSLLGLAAGPEVRDASKLVVLQHSALEFAVEVDEVIVPPAGEQLATAGSIGPGGPDPKFLRGVSPDGVITLDLDAVSSALVVNEEI